MDYRTTLADSRQGVNLTVQGAKQMAAVIAPLLKQGQYPYQIVTNHPELGISEKTLYNYIENGVFREIAGITVLDLRRQVSRRLSKKKAKPIKNVPAGSISKAEPTKIINSTPPSIPGTLLPKWTQSTMMRQTGLSFGHLNL